ncbi:MAG: DUF459 domain-containing protein [Actinomycetes bacterium]
MTQQRSNQQRSNQQRSTQNPRRRPRRVRRTQSAETVWKGLVIALIVFVVLASGNMVASAEGMPLGWQRSVAVATSGVIDRLTNLVSLNRPYDWAAQQLGVEQKNADFEFRATEEPAPEATATTTTLPPVRVPTAAEPLNVVVAGDSTAKGLGDMLKSEVTDIPELKITNYGKVSTGLARFDYFNWGARMQEIVATDAPEVTLFMVGANDGQSILEGDGTVVAQYGSAEWEEQYRARIAGIMDLNQGQGRRLIWIGEPNVSNPDIQQAVQTGNRIAQEEAKTRPWVSYFDVAKRVAGPDGGFADYITLPDGSTARCYAGDGVHLSVKCMNRVLQDLVPTLTGLYGSTTGSSTRSTLPPMTVPSTTAKPKN